MSNETTITVVGRLTKDPELKFTPSGAAVTNFTVASNARTFNKDTNEWQDEPAAFWPCSVWRQYAENVAESLTKGSHVIVVGNVTPRTWIDKEGAEQRRMEIQVSEVGPALRYATARTQKATRGASQDGFGGDTNPGWGSSTSNGGAFNDDPPF